MAERISVNVTLIFSCSATPPLWTPISRARATAAGRDLSRSASVASFFVSRVDTEVDARLDELATTAASALRGRAAVANAVLAFAHHDEILASDRWARLDAAGARPQRPLWASTGVKDPAYDDTRYVVDLVTAGVVNTMPKATLDAVADHGKLRGDTVRGCREEARKILDALTAVGIDYHRVVTTLEGQGAAKFTASGAQLATSLAERLRIPQAQPETPDFR
ncbi:transaldolase family protein [Pseudonocardia sp.]|uniref:transaldolase family protein n=1 Tax=Pseudonocardia sp. TaxID=60912 RepID=UPI00345CFA18